MRTPCVVHHLELHAPPLRKPFVVQRRAIPRDHHLTRQRREKLQQLHVVGLLVVEPISSLRATGAPQIRRVAVDEFRTLERELGEEPVGAAVNELDGVVALERIECARTSRSMPMLRNAGGLCFMIAPHTEMGLDVGRVRRSHRDEGLTQPRGRLRPEVAHPLNSHRLYGSCNIATRRYDVKDAARPSFLRFCPSRPLGALRIRHAATKIG